VHGGEEKIITAIAEMGDAAFGFPKIANRRGLVDGGHAGPDEAHGGLGIKIKSAHPGCAFHERQQRRDGVDAKAEQGIADGAGCFDFGECVGEPAADNAHHGRGVVKYRRAENHRFRDSAGKREEFGNQSGRVLTVPIHYQHMCETRGGGGAQTIQNGRSLAAVARPDEHAQVGILRGP
jgi:hypothetical protein